LVYLHVYIRCFNKAVYPHIHRLHIAHAFCHVVSMESYEVQEMKKNY